MVEASCHCGAVRLVCEIAPVEVTECNCSICRRYGTLWAYYPPRQVHLTPSDAATEVYLWGERTTAFHRCRICGCVTHWSEVDARSEWMGVNARLMPPQDIAGARRRVLDGADTWKYLGEP